MKKKSPKQTDFRTGTAVLTDSRVSDIMHLHPQLVEVDSDESAVVAFEKCVKNNILSVPIYDVSRQTHVGFLDMLDLLHHFLDSVAESHGPEGHSYSDFKTQFSSTPCIKLANISDRNPFHPIELNIPLRSVLSLIKDFNVHRFPVISESGNLSAVLTQSQIAKYLGQHIDKFDFAKKTIAELRFGYKDTLYTVTGDALARDAFHLMRDKEISGLGVVDSKGLLTGVMSVTDIRAVGLGSELFARLLLPVSEFLQIASEHRHTTHKEVKVLAVTPQDTIATVAGLFKEKRVHRLFVWDTNHKPLGVISLGDYLKLFIG